MDYMKKKTPIKGLLFYAIQGLDAPISLSLDGDDAYVTDNIVTAVFSLCFWPLVAILIEIGYSAGRSGTKIPSSEGQ